VPDYLTTFSGLIKLRVTLAVVLSAAVGYLMAKPVAETMLFVVSAGVFLLSAGSAVLNHVQERHLDARMERTKNRPVASGKVSAKTAGITAVMLAIAGFVLLLVFTGWLSATLGLVTLGIYNGVYTPLKRITPYALLPGGLVGAIPPAIGYTAAGGALLSDHLAIICLFFFVWQVPHFLLLLLLYGEEYAKAGFKTLNLFFSSQMLSTITWLWMITLACATILLATAGIVSYKPYKYVLTIATVTLLVATLPVLNPKNHQRIVPRMFRWINLFMVLIAHLVMFQHLYHNSE
jgi:heme o synthase